MKYLRSMLLGAAAVALIVAAPLADSAQAATSADASTTFSTADLSLKSVQSQRSHVAPTLISGTGFTSRVNWGLRNGDWKLNLFSTFFTKNTRAFVSIGECDLTGGKFIGSAKYTLYNVAPNTGVVSIWVNINWGAPIWLCVDYLFVNP
jgi:hypothetical protein